MLPLLIVSRRRPDLLSRFREAFAEFPELEIVLDRRAVAPERSDRSDRRQDEIDATLRMHGWALVGADTEPVVERPGARRVLVADDHEDSRHLLKWVLRRAGHDVRLADDGNFAIVAAHAWRPDLAIIDMFMPEKDGVEVIRALRLAAQPPKIIAISAGWRAGGGRLTGSPNDLDVLDDAQVEGADAVLAKPIDPRVLLDS